MFLNKFLKKPIPSIHPPAGLITDITDLDEFKQRLGLRSRAKTLSDLIKYLDTLPQQSWNIMQILTGARIYMEHSNYVPVPNKTFRSNSGKIRTVSIYDRGGAGSVWESFSRMLESPDWQYQ